MGAGGADPMGAGGADPGDPASSGGGEAAAPVNGHSIWPLEGTIESQGQRNFPSAWATLEILSTPAGAGTSIAIRQSPSIWQRTWSFPGAPRSQTPEISSERSSSGWTPTVGVSFGYQRWRQASQRWVTCGRVAITPRS